MKWHAASHWWLLLTLPGETFPTFRRGQKTEGREALLPTREVNREVMPFTLIFPQNNYVVRAEGLRIMYSQKKRTSSSSILVIGFPACLAVDTGHWGPTDTIAGIWYNTSQCILRFLTPTPWNAALRTTLLHSCCLRVSLMHMKH